MGTITAASAREAGAAQKILGSLGRRRDLPCQIQDPDMFFPPDAAGQEIAADYCWAQSCPVLAQCAAAAAIEGYAGVWGGTTEAMRRDDGPASGARRTAPARRVASTARAIAIRIHGKPSRAQVLEVHRELRRALGIDGEEV